LPSVLLLLSGGFDSPVAGYLLQQAGFTVHALNFSQEPFVDPSHSLKAQEISEKLGFESFFKINIGNELLEISQASKHAYYFVLMKRLMYKIASEVAILNNYDFIASGESVGQVSSQTLTNLAVLEDSISFIPILRPLITCSKDEIINVAKKIDTFEISKQPESCDRLGPPKPIINANREYTLNEESKVPMDKFIKDKISNFRKDYLLEPIKSS
jgi:thiamine biosynthesis protein ThiI